MFNAPVITGRVHTYPDIFENGLFPPPFSKKKYASTRCVFESFSPVHMKTLKWWKYREHPHRTCVMLVVYYVWHHRTRKPLIPSVRRHVDEKPASLKRCVFGDRFHANEKTILPGITLFCTFRLHCTTTWWKCLISFFVEDVNKRRRHSLPPS